MNKKKQNQSHNHSAFYYSMESGTMATTTQLGLVKESFTAEMALGWVLTDNQGFT